MVELFANSRDPDQMPHSEAFDLGLYCLSFVHLGVSSLHWVKIWTFKILLAESLDGQADLGLHCSCMSYGDCLMLA